VGPGTLNAVLGTLPVFSHPNLLVDGTHWDDAGVYRLNDEQALVQTVDFFTPVVDDPYIFGQIAAANALSDIYAMGATPLTALNLVAFPTCSLDLQILRDILAGGAERLQLAGALLIGGHTIEDREPKYGLTITGTVHPQKVVTNRGIQPGDVLILTKPIGTGVAVTAMKAGMISAATQQAAMRTMVALNKEAAEVMVTFKPRACTDITGFGLLGHAWELVAGSGTGLVLDTDRIPFLPGVTELACSGLVPAGAYRNRQYLEGKVHWNGKVKQEIADLLFDPQTSGGLLIAVPGDLAPDLVGRLHEQQVTEAVVIGRATGDHPGEIVVQDGL
jgi:selenide,water dikinase